MKRRNFLTLAAGLPAMAAQSPGRVIEIPADVLEDKIRGGFLGQVIGDLNGLKHEMKYILEPGNVEQYTPPCPMAPGRTTIPTSSGPTSSRSSGRAISSIPPARIARSGRSISTGGSGARTSICGRSWISASIRR